MKRILALVSLCLLTLAASPATRPAADPSEMAALRKEVAALAEQVRQLRAEVERLTHPADAPAAHPVDDAIEKAVQERRIVLGMTSAQVLKVMEQRHWTTRADQKTQFTAHGAAHERREMWGNGQAPTRMVFEDDKLAIIEQ